MSLMTKRQAVVDALSDLDELKPALFRPKQFSQGKGVAWVVQDSLVIDQQSGQYEDNFFVLVWMGTDQDQAAQWMSDHWEEIVNALIHIAYVDRVDMVAVDDGVAMQIKARSE